MTSEVKQLRARIVLGWGTAWEVLRVLSAFSHFFVLLLRQCGPRTACFGGECSFTLQGETEEMKGKRRGEKKVSGINTTYGRVMEAKRQRAEAHTRT